MKKNEYVIGKVENLGINGEGILHIEGTTVFVPFALPEEKIKVKILKVKGNIAFGKIDEILEKSPYRLTSPCKVFGKCGGCQLQHLKYEKQLEYKKEMVQGCLKKIAHIDYAIGDVVSSSNVYHYRNKLQLPIRCEKGINKIGFFREGSHDIIEIDDCLLHPDWAKIIIEIIKEFIAENGISCYSEENNGGLLKHLVVREVNNNLLIVLVANGKTMPHVNRLIDRFSKEFDKFSLLLNINLKNNNVVFGDEFKVLYGSGKIALTEFDVNYEIGAQSFMQVNQEQKHKLYNKVFELACVDENTVVIDGYSGAGVLTAMLAKRAKKAYGVEIIKEAVESANELAKANGLHGKMVNVCGDCADILPEIIKQTQENDDKTVLVLDPPRKGVDGKIISQILKSLPDKIIYISCSPQSLSRDLGLLLETLKMENGSIINSYADISKYKITYFTPFDLFCQTKHVENLVCLERVK